MKVPIVLLIEDDPDNILIVQRILRKAKFTNPLNVVEDGEAAIAYLSGQGIYQDRVKYPLPDLILLDLNLPRKSGFEVLAWLGQQPISQHATVTVLTSSRESNDIVQAYELGAHGYLVKPVDSAYLLDIVDALSLPLVKPFRTLVIDDNPDDRAIVIRILRKEFPDMEFREINSLAEFNQSLDLGDFELAISDYCLGWINGLTILRSIKSRCPDCPVVVCTGTSSEEIAAEMMRSGLDDYVLKSARHLLRLPSAVRMSLSRVNSRKALMASEARYRDLFENANDLILTTDLEGNITSFNRMAEQISGYTRQEALSMKVEQLIFPQSLETVREMVAKKLKEKVNAVYEIEGVSKNGRRVPLEISSSPIYKDDKIVGIQAIGRDITERKQKERELEAIARISSSLRTCTNCHEMLSVILDEAIAILKTKNGALSLFNPATGEMQIELGRGIWSSLAGRIIPPGEGFASHLIATSQPYLNNDVRNEPRLIWPELYHECQAVAGVPLSAQDQLIGVLWVARQEPITNNDLRLLGSIADISANAMHRATLFGLTELRLKRLTSLRTIDMAINSSLDLKVTLNIFLEQVISQLAVDATSVLLLNSYSQILEYTAGRGFQTRAVESSRLRLGEGFAGRIALDRRHILIKDLESQTAYLDKARSPVSILPSEFSHLPAEMARMKSERFVAYCGIPLIVKGQVKGVLEIFHRAALEPNEEWTDFLETLAGQGAIAIDNAVLFTDLQRATTELIVAYDTTLEGWSQALDLRDKETEGHSQRVTELSVRMARIMNISEAEIVHIRRGALLHDIGKMGVPDAILLKPGPLTDEEWAVMHKHPVYAYEMISPIAYLRPALNIPYGHHEKWDGTGYPLGLKGEQIPLAARIFALVDVWDALTSDRPYRPAWSKERALAHIRAGAGTHFDPRVVETFLLLEN